MGVSGQRHAPILIILLKLNYMTKLSHSENMEKKALSLKGGSNWRYENPTIKHNKESEKEFTEIVFIPTVFKSDNTHQRLLSETKPQN
jgi:hypothetical protein